MRGVDRDRCEQRVDGGRVVAFDVVACVVAQLAKAEHTDRFLFEGGEQLLAPALVLVVHKVMDAVRQFGENFLRKPPIGTKRAVALLYLLHHSGKAHLDKLVEIASRDGQEFYALEKRIIRVASFLEDAFIELEPRVVAIEVLRRFGRGAERHASLV
jgi:hypothetical protein